MQHRALLRLRISGQRRAIRTDERRVVASTASRSENSSRRGSGRAPKSATVSPTIQAMCSGSFRWMNVPRPESFETTFGCAARARMPVRQAIRPPSDRSSSIPACCRMKVVLGNVRARAAPRPPSAAQRPAGRRKGRSRRAQRSSAEGSDRRQRSGRRGEAVLPVLVPVKLHADAADAADTSSAGRAPGRTSSRHQVRHSRRSHAASPFRRPSSAPTRPRPRRAPAPSWPARRPISPRRCRRCRRDTPSIG